MPISKSLAALLGATLLVCGCATPPRFEWGNYEGSLYAYAKNPTKRQNYMNALEKAVEVGERSNRVAPGLLAELGYLHLEDGDMTAAVSCFEKEMALFPESRPFLTGVIARAKGSSRTVQKDAAR